MGKVGLPGLKLLITTIIVIIIVIIVINGDDGGGDEDNDGGDGNDSDGGGDDDSECKVILREPIRGVQGELILSAWLCTQATIIALQLTHWRAL